MSDKKRNFRRNFDKLYLKEKILKIDTQKLKNTNKNKEPKISIKTYERFIDD